MATVGTLSVDLLANTASFNANIEKAAANLNSHAVRMNKSLHNIESGIEGIKKAGERMKLAIEAFGLIEGVKSGLEYAASLGVVAKQVGLTTDNLQLYREAGRRAGVSQDEMDLGLRKLTLSLGKGSVGAEQQKKVLEGLGISLIDVSGNLKTADTVLPEFADKMAKTASPIQRAAAEVGLLGKAGQQLDPLLSRGGKAIEDFGKQAKDAGLIIGEDFIEKAHAAEIAVGGLTQKLKVDWSMEVAKNADAIMGLSGALNQLEINALRFIYTYPKLSGALAGAAIGARFGGAPGAIIGGGIGLVGGALAERSTADSNLDVNFRRQQLAAAQAELAARQAASKNNGLGGLFKLRHSSADGGTLASQQQEVQRQMGLYQRAIAVESEAKANTGLPNVNLPNFLAGGGQHSGRDPAEAAREKALREQKEFADLQASLDQGLIAAKRANLTDIDKIAAFDREAINVAQDKLVADLQAKAGKNPIILAQEKIFRAEINQARNIELWNVTFDQIRKHQSDGLRMQIASNDDELEMLRVKDQMALTQAEHRKIQLMMLGIEEENLKKSLRDQILNEKDDARKKSLQTTLEAVPGVYAKKTAVVDKATAGPLEVYINGLTLTDDQIREKVQGLEIAELEAVRQGIDGAITNALGIHDPLLAGLVDLFIQNVLIRPIAEALRGASDGGAGGGFLGSLFSFIPHLFGFADGTSNAPPGYAWVGERGPELLKFRGGEQVIPNHMLGGGGGSTRISVEASPYFDVRVNGMITQAAPAIAKAGSDVAQRQMAYRQSRSLAA